MNNTIFSFHSVRCAGEQSTWWFLAKHVLLLAGTMRQCLALPCIRGSVNNLLSVLQEISRVGLAKLKLANVQRSLEAFNMLQEIGFELFLIQFMSVDAVWLVSGGRPLSSRYLPWANARSRLPLLFFCGHFGDIDSGEQEKRKSQNVIFLWTILIMWGKMNLRLLMNLVQSHDGGSKRSCSLMLWHLQCSLYAIMCLFLLVPLTLCLAGRYSFMLLRISWIKSYAMQASVYIQTLGGSYYPTVRMRWSNRFSCLCNLFCQLLILCEWKLHYSRHLIYVSLNIFLNLSNGSSCAVAASW